MAESLPSDAPLASAIERRVSLAVDQQPWVGYAAAVVAVALVTVLASVARSPSGAATLPMLYSIAVLATAAAFGSGPAVLASVAAFLAFNWFFVEPLYTFHVAEPQQWISLVVFLLTSIVTGQLASSLRSRVREARLREREAVVLYDVVQLMAGADLHAALRSVAERIRQELELSAVAIQLGGEGHEGPRIEAGDAEGLHIVHSSGVLPARVLSEGPPPGLQPGSGRWVRTVPPQPGGSSRALRDRLLIVPIRAREARVGLLLLARPTGAAALGAHEERLLAAAATQLGQAVERARLQREATESEVLRLSDELKTALLNAVSHDLRTPLASIIASAGSLQQQDVAWTEEERREFAQSVEEEARRLNRIVSNLLDLSRIEGGSLRAEKSWHDLAALVDDVLGRLGPITAHHPISVHIPESLPPVPLDYTQIDQALSNLVENAVRHTPSETPIEIAARQQDGEIVVSVSDRGPGLAAADLPHVFDPFFRAERGGPRGGGVGLGLGIARGLVEAHGGRIWAENGPHGGASFAFTLPIGGLAVNDADNPIASPELSAAPAAQTAPRGDISTR
jgi:two-component system, OmpR family, sensor histidine kinase KdpD